MSQMNSYSYQVNHDSNRHNFILFTPHILSCCYLFVVCKIAFDEGECILIESIQQQAMLFQAIWSGFFLDSIHILALILIDEWCQYLFSDWLSQGARSLGKRHVKEYKFLYSILYAWCFCVFETFQGK